MNGTDENMRSKVGSEVPATNSFNGSSINYENPLAVETKSPNKKDACGYGPCHPKWLQVFLKPKVLVATLCCFAFIQSYVVSGLNNSNTATYERRFFLSSYKVGIISSVYDFSAGILVIPISYFGAHVHKPRMLAITAILFGLGSLVMMLPHIITDVYNHGQGTTNMCNVAGDSGHLWQNNRTTCQLDNDDDTLPNYFYVLCLGMVLHGIGGTTLYTVGTAVVDECVSQDAAGLAIGVMYAVASLGPALGFIIGGQLLSIYVDVDVIDMSSIDFDSTDPRWIGAWWIGFISSASLILLVALVLFTFPRHIPVSERILRSRIDQSQEGQAEKVAKPGFGTNILDLPIATANLLKNWPFLFTSLAGVSDGFVASGFATFTAKFIEQQFNQTVSFSNIIFGAIVIPSAAGGQIIGGYVCKKAKLKVRGMLMWSITCSVVTALLAATFWLHCDDPPIAGVNRVFGNGSLSVEIVNTVSNCNDYCKCSNVTVHEPVCGADHLEYLTPCIAGCRDEKTENKEKTFYNCSCIDLALSNGSTTATPGRCDGGSCNSFYIALALLFCLIFALFLIGAPLTAITLRCVMDSQRTYALGVQWVFMRFLGMVPGPIVFGVVLDAACKMPKQSCSGAEVCWIYDRFLLSRNMFLLAFIFKFVTTIFYLIAYVLYKPHTAAEHEVNRPKSPGSEASYRVEDSKSNHGLEPMQDNTANVFENKAFEGESQVQGVSKSTPTTDL